MRVGVGLPSTVPGAPGGLLVDWARAAEAGPFSSLGVLDRFVYDSYDPFASLAAAAAVTERIGLVTMVVIGPLRPAGTLAKQAASVDAISGGRLTLGVALGAVRQHLVVADARIVERRAEELGAHRARGAHSALARSRNVYFCTLPVDVVGSAPNTTVLGIAKCGRLSRQNVSTWADVLSRIQGLSLSSATSSSALPPVHKYVLRVTTVKSAA